MTHYSRQDVIRSLGEFIAPRRGVIHEELCYYEKDGFPSCGVGQWLHAEGVSVDTLTRMDESGNSGFGNTIPMCILTLEGYTFEDGAVEVLRDFQRMQDDKYPWGKAFHWATAGEDDA